MKKCVCGCEMTRHDWKNQWVCHRCGRTKPIEVFTTNADRIRAMSDEELADLFSAIADDGRSCTLICTNYDKCKRNNAIEVICRNHYLDWLKQPVKDGEDK